MIEPGRQIGSDRDSQAVIEIDGQTVIEIGRQAVIETCRRDMRLSARHNVRVTARCCKLAKVYSTAMLSLLLTFPKCLF